MYNLNALQDCFGSLVGFVANSKDFGVIDKDLSHSDTGVYVDTRMHPLFTIENLMAVVRTYSKDNLPTWSNGITYSKGQLVTDGTDMYISLAQENLGNGLTSSFWKKTSQANQFIRNLFEGAATKVVQLVSAQKKLSENAKTLVTDLQLYTGVGNTFDAITKLGRFVGYKLQMKDGDIVAVLNKIGLQLTQPQSLNLYLYHSTQSEAVKIVNVTHDKVNSFKWHDVKNVLVDYAKQYDEGYWYLGYYESDLIGQAVNKKIRTTGDFSCATCERENVALRRKWSNYINVKPFYVAAENLNLGRAKWDDGFEFDVDETTFGMNLQMSIRCDMTGLICSNIDLLSDLYALQIKHDLLETMAYSVRDNQVRERLSMLAAVALTDPVNKGVGVKFEISKAAKAVSFDFSSISSLCMPCLTKGSKINYSSVWG